MLNRARLDRGPRMRLQEKCELAGGGALEAVQYAGMPVRSARLYASMEH
jgi:hypothetical protein